MVDIRKMRLRYVTNRKGKKTEVIIRVKDFEELLEDLNDLNIVVERRKEETISHKDLLKTLKQDGIL